MKKSLTNIFPILTAVIVIGSTMFSHSCANTSQAPTGGLRDTLPPIIVNIEPLPGAVNVSRTGSRFVFTFNEYFQIKEAKNIVVSPPLKTMLKTRINGKKLELNYEEDTLRDNTTYTIDFIQALADNNEGNMFPGYTYVFSTGEILDSMMITGIVQDCNTLKPIKGATVLLYRNTDINAVFSELPDATTKTDDWGFFAIRNIPDCDFRLYAITDENSNYKYDPETESIGFITNPVHPSRVANDSIYELKKFDMKDTLQCQKRKTEYEINVFKEKNAKQMLMNKVRVDDRTSYITFMAPKAHIDTMWIQGISADRLITQFNAQRDSLEIWVNDLRQMPDTFHLFVNYRKTDTLGKLVPFTEEVKLVNPVPTKVKKRKTLKDIQHTDTICVCKLTGESEKLEEHGFEMEFKVPIVYENFNNVVFTVTNPKQQVDTSTFTVVPDSTNLRKYYLIPDVKLLPGFEYKMKLPEGAFTDINGYHSDSLEVKAKLPDNEKLSELHLDMQGISHKYIVDLLNESMTKTIRSYVITEDTILAFPYLQAGKYSVRITEDLNGNSMVDTGDLLLLKQPEQVKFFKIKDGSNLLDIPEGTELVQIIDITEMFKENR